MSDILSIAEASALLQSRKLSPVELLDACLGRIERWDGELKSFIHVSDERARTDSRAAEARIMAGRTAGPLDGIPIAHKDVLATRGIPTTGHSRWLEDSVPEADAEAVRKLAQAGTTLVGKLATYEFAMGGPSHDLPWPFPRNPWNLDRFAGGSSTGSGVAVAAGFVLGATGSDTGGSIRVPSAFCGIAGLKPTYGLVSNGGLHPLAYSMDHVGPMAWSAEDCAMLLDEMVSGRDRAPDSYRSELGDGIAGLKIGVIRNFFEEDLPASPAQCQAIDAAAGILTKLGATVETVRLSSLLDYHACGATILCTEAAAVHEHWIKRDPGRYGQRIRGLLTLGSLFTGVDYVQATRRRGQLRAEMSEALERYDVLITASSTGEPARLEEVPYWTTMSTPTFTIPFNVTGHPSLSICCGFGDNGLPLGVQVVGRHFDEATVLRVGHSYERETGPRKRPGMVGGATG